MDYLAEYQRVWNRLEVLRSEMQMKPTIKTAVLIRSYIRQLELMLDHEWNTFGIKLEIYKEWWDRVNNELQWNELRF
jgi:hypothetical protein